MRRFVRSIVFDIGGRYELVTLLEAASARTAQVIIGSSGALAMIVLRYRRGCDCVAAVLCCVEAHYFTLWCS